MFQELDNTFLQGARYTPGQMKGHYESYFFRANHPEKKQGFWIRYTIFQPRWKPKKAIGELWAIWFDGETDKLVAVKSEVPWKDCGFGKELLSAHVGPATATSGAIKGKAALGSNTIAWDLNYSGLEPPVLFLPRAFYDKSLPKAKSIIPRPNVHFDGTLTVNGETIAIEEWQGSENHNWGEKHTDEYAWGQVCGFDTAPDSFLEVITARVKIGLIPSPWMTIAYLRHNGEDYVLNDLKQAFTNKGEFEFEGKDEFTWRFDAQKEGVRIKGEITAPRKHFIGLTYYNPPGGSHTCLNSKIGACVVSLRTPEGETRLVSNRNAAFEILTDRTRHGVPMATLPKK